MVIWKGSGGRSMLDAKYIWLLPLALCGVAVWLAASRNRRLAQTGIASVRNPARSTSPSRLGKGLLASAWRDGWSN